MKVFVYGTLKKGGWLHSNIVALKGILKEENAVLNGFEMFDLGAFPAIIKKEDSSISGEVYELDETLDPLNRLDAVEGYPRLYDRELSSEHNAWVYFMHKKMPGSAKIESGNWDVNKRQ